MFTAQDAIGAVGSALFDVLVEGRALEVSDVFVAEPGDDAVGQRGDLVLGVGVASPADAAALLARCADGKASGLVVRRAAVDDGLVSAAEERALLLVGLDAGVSWAHVVWMLRGVVDRAAAPDSPADTGVHNDLFALADAAAAIVEAPVTIEDNQSRVLAYSSGQSLTDTARVSTIVGRRVPPDVVAHYRARGVFRRLARSSEPFLVEAGPDGTRPRLVVPVRAGGEWLGSIWAVVDGPVAAEVSAEMVNAASVLALHLLRLRAEADVARRTAVERVRAALREYAPGRVDPASLPPAPWRVAALSWAGGGSDVPEELDLWSATCRRYGWAEPVLADLDRTVFAVVGSGGRPGSWTWLRGLVTHAGPSGPVLRAAAGGPVTTAADLPRSRVEAAELLTVLAPGEAAVFEEAWVPVTVARAAAALDPGSLGGPVATLARHDEERGTGYVETLGAWLGHLGEPRRAAQALHVHVNTLRHRMRRITALVDLDLDDPRERLALQLQIEAFRTRGRPGTASMDR